MSERDAVTLLTLWRETAEWDWVLVGSHGTRLHAVARVIDPDAVEREWGGHGTVECGRGGYLTIPGIGARMSAKRCDRCCDLTGMPRGSRSPKNTGAECRPVVQARLDDLAREAQGGTDGRA